LRKHGRVRHTAYRREEHEDNAQNPAQSHDFSNIDKGKIGAWSVQITTN
jgi:hypothetical protein